MCELSLLYSYSLTSFIYFYLLSPVSFVSLSNVFSLFFHSSHLDASACLCVLVCIPNINYLENEVTKINLMSKIGIIHANHVFSFSSWKKIFLSYILVSSNPKLFGTVPIFCTVRSYPVVHWSQLESIDTKEVQIIAKCHHMSDLQQLGAL